MTDREDRLRGMQEKAAAARDARREAMGGDLADIMQDIRTLSFETSPLIHRHLSKWDAMWTLMQIDWEHPMRLRALANLTHGFGREDLSEQWTRLADRPCRVADTNDAGRRRSGPEVLQR